MQGKLEQFPDGDGEKVEIYRNDHCFPTSEKGAAKVKEFDLQECKLFTQRQCQQAESKGKRFKESQEDNF